MARKGIPHPGPIPDRNLHLCLGPNSVLPILIPVLAMLKRGIGFFIRFILGSCQIDNPRHNKSKVLIKKNAKKIIEFILIVIKYF